MVKQYKKVNIDNTIKNAKITKKTAQKIFFEKYGTNTKDSFKELLKLSNMMDNVTNTTDKALKGAILAESRVKARYAAVKKASAETIKYTARAKRAAIASKKAVQSAAITSKKIQRHTSSTQKLHSTYQVQVQAAISAAKNSEVNSSLALKHSKIARAAARIALKELKL